MKLEEKRDESAYVSWVKEDLSKTTAEYEEHYSWTRAKQGKVWNMAKKVVNPPIPQDRSALVFKEQPRAAPGEYQRDHISGISSH